MRPTGTSCTLTHAGRLAHPGSPPSFPPAPCLFAGGSGASRANLAVAVGLDRRTIEPNPMPVGGHRVAGLVVGRRASLHKGAPAQLTRFAFWSLRHGRLLASLGRPIRFPSDSLTRPTQRTPLRRGGQPPQTSVLRGISKSRDRGGCDGWPGWARAAGWQLVRQAPQQRRLGRSRDGEMGMGYGSECHVLRYLGRPFDDQVLRVTGGDRLGWLDFGFDPSRP
jgi:hypothetical protein